MRELLPGGDAFGATIWISLTLADFALVFTQPWWQAGNGGPAGCLSALGLILGLVYAYSRFSPATPESTEEVSGDG